jgi:hypothetical protein
MVNGHRKLCWIITNHPEVQLLFVLHFVFASIISQTSFPMCIHHLDRTSDMSFHPLREEFYMTFHPMYRRVEWFYIHQQEVHGHSWISGRQSTNWLKMASFWKYLQFSHAWATSGNSETWSCSCELQMDLCWCGPWHPW